MHNAFFDRSFKPMKIHYFPDTDTLYIEFNARGIHERRDLDGNTIINVYEEGRICAMTLEHARDRADLASLSHARLSAWPT